jgi:hypothetical protein
VSLFAIYNRWEHQEIFFTSKHINPLTDPDHIRSRLDQLLYLTKGGLTLLDPVRGRRVIVHEMVRFTDAETCQSAVSMPNRFAEIERLRPYDPTLFTDDYLKNGDLNFVVGLALRDDQVRSVVRHLADDPTWGNLYKIYEIIKAAEGIAYIKKLFSEEQIFRRTAHDPAAAGDGARHAVFNQDTVPFPMKLEDATQNVRDLAFEWLRDNSGRIIGAADARPRA